jgi:hypothetical protein
MDVGVAVGGLDVGLPVDGTDDGVLHETNIHPNIITSMDKVSCFIFIFLS